MSCAEMTSKVGVAHKISRALTRAVYLAPPPTVNPGSAPDSIICTRQEELGNEDRFPKIITTVQCSVCSQLNNKPRVVATDTILAIIYGSTKWMLLYYFWNLHKIIFVVIIFPVLKVKSII